MFQWLFASVIGGLGVVFGCVCAAAWFGKDTTTPITPQKDPTKRWTPAPGWENPDKTGEIDINE